ncbi:hypothetical protein GTW51_16365 [Aurantimonas aggregata]|uniref:Uncharacterized protein n=1 Tax=Aurantimonas aggregata TaxID=2047720 RepID=A0A6L9MKJ9_9HYPH|nr:hypothetical protein [Aurantimonas aggregata]NDV88275.1 hypothetical protein [Aurantimonas aggregata]
MADIDMQTNLGSLIGRPDLADDVIASALCERLRAEGRSDDDAHGILSSARQSESEAASLLRTIAVPAPSAKLTMPTQQLASTRRRFSLGGGFAKLSLGR